MPEVPGAHFFGDKAYGRGMDAQEKATGSRHEDAPSTARRVGRGAAAAIGGATLSLPVPVMAMGVETEMIAGAKTPDEVLDAVDRIARSNSTAAVDFLEKFTTSTWRARRQRSDALGKLTIVPND